MNNKYESVLLAEYLRAIAFSKKIVLKSTQLQKILYIIYGHYLANKNSVIINERPKAWIYGPVFPRVYKNVDLTKVQDINDDKFNTIKENTELFKFLEKVIDKCYKISASQFSEWSCAPGGPWDKTIKDSKGKFNAVIPDEYLKGYFFESFV